MPKRFMTSLNGLVTHYFMLTSHQKQILQWHLEGCDALFILMPIAPNIEDTPELRDHYLEKIIKRFEEKTKQSIQNNIIFKESFCVNDFKSEYNSYKGNAYGMAMTLLQTAFLRPKLKSY